MCTYFFFQLLVFAWLSTSPQTTSQHDRVDLLVWQLWFSLSPKTTVLRSRLSSTSLKHLLVIFSNWLKWHLVDQKSFQFYILQSTFWRVPPKTTVLRYSWLIVLSSRYNQFKVNDIIKSVYSIQSLSCDI